MTGRGTTSRSTTWLRRLLVAGGVLAAGYGVAGLVTDPSVAKQPYLRYTLTVLLGHDLLVMPLAILIGLLATRRLPQWARPAVQGALLVTATLTAVALPLVLGYGRRSDDPSALPRDYHRGYLIAVAAIWLTTAALLALRAARRRRTSATQPQEET